MHVPTTTAVRLISAVVAAATLLGCGAPGRATCGDRKVTVVWAGHQYVEDLRVHAKQGARLGTVVDVCGTSEKSVYRYRGVAPRVAIVVAGDHVAHAYLAEGFLLQLAGYPLHRQVGAQKKAFGSRCAERFRFDVRMKTPAPHLLVRRLGDGKEIALVLLESAVVRTGDRQAGLPYLPRGKTVSVAGRRCGPDYVVADISPVDA